ncbi:conserved phage C-terminal domain-containing protein [Neobacillus cucumis]|uniref:conserved phage C-terminal domain-containing protein n=1 Tax=Neobacillus cucumis TaxID=1740721 RepID=UPI0018DEF8A1|nr:conserved phage C-terminal domain-containing protein [Neobacillus cucumis]MBI0580693.1 conserved phage C-terminal domain-containing protein [Neobacillus cucumis]
MSSLLLNESPMIVLPSLVKKIGLNEAIILQQIHYWIQKSSHVIEGKTWIYNTYQQWHQQFSFWSLSTIKRTIRSLEDQGLLLSGNWNRSKMDHTKWYTIDYERLATLELTSPEPKIHEVETEIDPTEPETASETSQKTSPITEIITYLNEKTNAAYKTSSQKTKVIIQTRMREGFTLEDFKKVIDLKTAQWLHDSRMSKYLRPETLFGPKFESYLNQKSFNPNLLRAEDFDLDDLDGDG